MAFVISHKQGKNSVQQTLTNDSENNQELLSFANQLKTWIAPESENLFIDPLTLSSGSHTTAAPCVVLFESHELPLLAKIREWAGPQSVLVGIGPGFGPAPKTYDSGIDAVVADTKEILRHSHSVLDALREVLSKTLRSGIPRGERQQKLDAPTIMWRQDTDQQNIKGRVLNASKLGRFIATRTQNLQPGLRVYVLESPADQANPNAAPKIGTLRWIRPPDSIEGPEGFGIEMELHER